MNHHSRLHLHFSPQVKSRMVSSISDTCSPQKQSAQVSDNTRVILSLPLRAESKDAGTLIPLDALFTHTNHTSLFIEHDGKAEELTVSIQKIFGNAALLNESLPDGTSVLLNRALISGEAITLAQ